MIFFSRAWAFDYGIELRNKGFEYIGWFGFMLGLGVGVIKRH